jgi:hypothetical protein
MQLVAGTLWEITGTFKDPNNNLVNPPNGFSVKYVSPAGTATTIVFGVASNIVQVSNPGVFQVQIDTTGWTAGQAKMEWIAPGLVVTPPQTCTFTAPF